MKLLKSAFLTSFIFFSSLFICIGYAKLTDKFDISANIDGITPKPYKGVYIVDARVTKSTNISSSSFDYIKPTNLKNILHVSSVGATITYEITVHNNSDMTYWYLGPKTFAEYESNNLINATNGITIQTKDTSESNSTLFDTNDWIPPQTYRTFYATYHFGSKATNDIETMVNFDFGLHMASVQDEFLAILNNRMSPTAYQYLIEVFNNKYEETGSQIISNIGEEKEYFDVMFGGDLSVNIDGEEKPVTIMIERKDVDGDLNSGDDYPGNNSPSGCEYTLYITVDDLSSPGEKATVYAVSYTSGSNTLFYQIGELYEGTCTIQDYNSSDNKYEGSFDLDNWKATQKEYSVTDLITYKVGYQQGTSYDKYNTIEELMSATDQEFYNKVNNNSSRLLIPVCNIIYTYRHQNGQWVESDNEKNKYNPGFDLLKAAFDNIKPYCYIGNGAQEVKLQNANSLSRAELIPLLEAIQNAYNYYLEVNPTN